MPNTIYIRPIIKQEDQFALDTNLIAQMVEPILDAVNYFSRYNIPVAIVRHANKVTINWLNDRKYAGIICSNLDFHTTKVVSNQPCCSCVSSGGI